MVENNSDRIELPVVEGFNSEFFNQFGHPDDAESWLHGSKLLTVRHAQSAENVHWMENDQNDTGMSSLTDDIIYNKLFDCHLSEIGIQQAKNLQPLANQFEFPGNKVYCSPHRRTLETLCNMLDTHKQKSQLTVVLIPLAKEVFSSYGNVPVLVESLKRECQEKVVRNFGFKQVDYTLLNDDNLWYLKQMEVGQDVKQRYLAMAEPVKDGDHITVFKQIFSDRAA